MLTKNDLSQIKLLITVGSSQIFNEIEKIKEEIQGVKEQVNLLPTKEDYFSSIDELMGEVKKSREEQTTISGQLSNHSDRLEKLEEKVDVPH